MERLPALNGRDVVLALGRAGLVCPNQRGSHAKLCRGEMTVIVPVHAGRAIKPLTMLVTIKEAVLAQEQFAQLLR